MTLLYDELRDAVAGRTVESRADASGRRFVALSVRFSRPIPERLLAKLEAERPHALARIPGALGPLAVEIAPSLITLILEPVDLATLRLDTLLAALAWSGSPLGSPLSAYVVVELCRAAQALHNTLGVDELPRVHGEIHPGTVLIDPGGHLRLFGAGLPAISSVLIPRLASRADRHRLLSPEAARGEPLDPRTDVYSLGVLYYELLSGHRYRDHLNPTAIAQAAIEGRPPDLPASLPDPRRELVHVLSRALAPNREHRFQNARMFADAIVNELASAKIPLPHPSVLERMVDEFVPAGVERGKEALLRAEHDPRELEAIMSGSTESIGAAQPVTLPLDTPTAPSPPATPDAWSKILGEPLDDHVPTESTPPAVEEKRSLSLPLPPAEKISSGPTKPLSGEHLAALATRREPKRRPTRVSAQDDDGAQHTPVRIAIGLAAIALVAAIGYGIQKRPRHDATVWEVTDAGVDTFDAGQHAIAPAPAPDSGVVEARPIGLLTVLSKPSGASVEIDDGYVGKTPLVMKHDFQNRPYRIRVLADGYQTWEQTAYPDIKMSISVIAELVKEPGN